MQVPSPARTWLTSSRAVFLRGGRARPAFSPLFLLSLWACAATQTSKAAEPTNLARTAKITANAQLNDEYSPALIADDRIPEPGSRQDAGLAWCVPQAKAANAQLTFSWTTPVTISEIVYYGRTAWLWNENFLSVQVFLDDAPQPIFISSLKPGHGPQRLRLPSPRLAHRLTLNFPTADDGPNPGASEVRIFDFAPTEAALGKFAKSPSDLEASGIPESPTLAAKLQRGELGFQKMLLIQRRPITPSHVYTYHCEGLQPGGGLFVQDLASGNQTRLVDASDGVILDCDLSPDGKDILFSWKRGDAGFQVYRIGIRGQGLRQLTEGDSANFNACWLPDGGIGFLSTRRSAYAYCWSSPAGILHRMDRDGRHVRQLSANYLNDFTPSVLNDGRIIYSRWEYVDRPAIPIQSLWTINPDGTGLRVYFGNRVLSPATFMEPRAIPGSDNILCLLTAHNGPCRGAIGIIDRREGVNAQAAIRNLTPEVNIGKVDESDGNFVHGPYESAYPLDSRYFLVTRAGAILIRDYDGTEQAVVSTKPRDGTGFYGAQPIRSRSIPPVRPRELPVKPQDGAWATLFVQDIYAGLEPAVQRGEIKELRVVEEIAKPVSVNPDRRLFGFQFPVVSCGATYAPKKVWGSVPVGEDGSVSFRVPANVPIYFMALDAEGRAVQRMRSFTHLQAGEVQGCVGCHANREQTPLQPAAKHNPNRPVQNLVPPEWGAKGFSYLEVVQPVLDRHCIRCHNAREHPRGVDLSGDRTDIFNVSYEILARKGTPAEDAHQGGARMAGFKNPYTSWIPTYNGTEENILQIQPRSWGSPASPLAEIIRGGHPDDKGQPRIDLSASERRRIYTWIDCNVPYYPTSASRDLSIPGCRQLYPADLDRVLASVAARRCANCHGQGKVPREFFTRIEKPEDNAFLLAPLSRQAGGTERCGQAVFTSVSDADYQAILNTFASTRRALEERPRLDVVAWGTTQR